VILIHRAPLGGPLLLAMAKSACNVGELDAILAEDEARAEAAKKQKRQQKSLAQHIAKAKELGVDVTVEPNGTATFRTGSSVSAPVDKSQTELDEWIAKHAH
jgi:hypothetical protein